MSINKPIAIIPARGGSKRLPRKNIAPIMNQPMISWPIKACLEAGIFERVVVSTEDSEIADVAATYGAQVVIRPEELATDEIHEGEAHNHVLDTLSGEGIMPEHFLVIYATAILVTAEDIKAAYHLTQKSTEPDAVMSMSPYPYHPYKAFLEGDDKFWHPMFPKECKMQTQTYPHALAVNGTFCWLRTAPWHENMHYFPDKFACYEMPMERAIDIDTPEDYERAKIFCEISKVATK